MRRSIAHDVPDVEVALEGAIALPRDGDVVLEATEHVMRVVVPGRTPAFDVCIEVRGLGIDGITEAVERFHPEGERFVRLVVHDVGIGVSTTSLLHSDIDEAGLVGIGHITHVEVALHQCSMVPMEVVRARPERGHVLRGLDPVVDQPGIVGGGDVGRVGLRPRGIELDLALQRAAEEGLGPSRSRDDALDL